MIQGVGLFQTYQRVSINGRSSRPPLEVPVLSQV
jgi:hypothetical protein